MSGEKQQKRQIRLGAFLMETGHHIAAWRHPDAHAGGGLDFAHYAEQNSTRFFSPTA
jgi:N-acetyl-S-(2-succino)cysteine monooxygenase